MSKPLTPQQMFDRMWKHFVTNKAPQSISEGTCVYEMKPGVMCGIGVQLTRDQRRLVKQFHNDTDVRDMCMVFPDISIRLGFDANLDFLEALQICHDDDKFFFQKNRKPMLRELAKEYGLKAPKG